MLTEAQIRTLAEQLSFSTDAQFRDKVAQMLPSATVKMLPSRVAQITLYDGRIIKIASTKASGI
jgi:ppGpp synthetase/RelA/SpoT-type nucleotidyltranferase